MKSGYCSIIVKNIDRAVHQGRWVCASALTGSTYESSDEFQVNVFDSSEEDSTIAVAGVTGMVIVIILVASALIFVIYKRYRRRAEPSSQRRNSNESDNHSGIELSVIESSAARNEGEILQLEQRSTPL